MTRHGVAARAPMWRRLWRHAGPAMRRERHLLTTVTITLLLEAGLRLIEPWPLKFVFDTVLATPPVPLGLPLLDSASTDVQLAAAALAVLALAGARAGAAYASTVGGALAGNRVVASLRERVYAHLQQLPLAYHARSRTGDLTVRLTGDVGVMKDAAVTALLPMASNVLVLLGMAAVMAWFNWSLAVLALALLPLLALSTRRLGRRIRETARQQRQHEGSLAARAAESLAAVRVVRALSLEEQVGDAFEAGERASLSDGVKGKRLEARLERTADLLIAVATAAVLVHGARLVLLGQLTPGDLLVFLSYLRIGFKPVRDFAKYAGRLSKAGAAAERVLDVLDETPEWPDAPDAQPLPPVRGAVTFDRVSFGYDPDRAVLHDVSMVIAPGEHVFLLGPSGTGKTTLVGLLLRLYRPTAGAIRLDDIDISQVTAHSLRRQCAIVLQDTVLFAGTLHDNIACGMSGVTRHEVREAARLADAADFIDHLPHGYDTAVGERGANLSAGQRQRIAVARAALRNAALVVVDEPTTGLDPQSRQRVVEALRRLCVGRTAVFITHELDLADRLADRIVWMEHGRIVESGTPEELRAAGGAYARALRLGVGEASHAVAG